jgi:hypothetical protein
MASNLVEIRKVLEEYGVGRIVSSHDPVQLSKTANEMLDDAAQYEIWKEKLNFASSELCWENEEQKLTQIYAHLAG